MDIADGVSGPTIPRYLALLWGRDDPAPRRGPRPTITIHDIGRTAVAIADAHGVEAVSMKAIAADLGLSTMSLYRYVDSKDDIYELMVDEAYGQADRTLTASGDWRARVRTWALAIADGLRQRPWLATIPMARPPVGPRVLSWTEIGVQCFADTSLTGEQKLNALLLVDGFVRQHVRQSTQMGLLESGPDSNGHTYEELLVELVTPAEFPHLASAAADQDQTDDDFFTEQLDFGLSVILDGLAGLVESQ
ncbi:TetR/AcrR family transcriptional regulator [Gordonia sp. CPCC 206044]|uniref:TetR/AcrR family transcriptional regulator n=1 Tax=Gordonia sp. CPCC 206044 TaxID=3140793 RepID=UPI003AF366A0